MALLPRGSYSSVVGSTPVWRTRKFIFLCVLMSLTKKKTSFSVFYNVSFLAHYSEKILPQRPLPRPPNGPEGVWKQMPRSKREKESLPHVNRHPGRAQAKRSITNRHIKKLTRLFGKQNSWTCLTTIEGKWVIWTSFEHGALKLSCFSIALATRRSSKPRNFVWA